MTKPNKTKPNKERAKSYGTILAINGSFNDVLNVLATPTAAKKDSKKK
jgi:hypothetical protein